MQATTVAPILDALLERFRAGILDAEVTDGEPLHLNTAKVLSIGYSANRPSVEITQSFSDLGNGRDERMSIACLASSLRGEMDATTVRRVRLEADALLDAVATELAEDPSLGGLVERAEVGLTLALDQQIARDEEGRGRGLVALIEFTIDVAVL